MSKKKIEKHEDVAASTNGVYGEIVGYEVKDLPKQIIERRNDEGEITCTETKNARVVGAVVVRFMDDDEARTLTLHVQGRHFSKYRGDDINWTDNRPIKDEIFHNLVQKIPFGSTVPLKKRPNRDGKDNRSFYTIDMSALKID